MHTEDFTSLIQDHFGLLLKVARTYGTQPAAQEDVLQEIIYQLWRSRHRLDPERKASTWLYRVALNVAISHNRKERKHRRKRTVLDAEHAIEFEPPPLPPAAEALHACIRELPELDRAVMLLHLEGNDDETAAAILGIRKTNVSTRLHRSRNRLRTSITARLRAEGELEP